MLHVFVLLLLGWMFPSPIIGSNLPKRLCGKYNNQLQLQRNSKHHRLSRKDGGHEAVEVEIVPSTNQPEFLIASYKFSNDSIPFRYRGYLFIPSSPSCFLQRIKNLFSPNFRMLLLRPSKDLLGRLELSQYRTSNYIPSITEFDVLEGCEIYWSKRFSWRRMECYYYGKLLNEPYILPSMNNPGEMIQVKDELYYWLGRNELWVNDRVYNMQGELLIGNLLNIPYQFSKLCS